MGSSSDSVTSPLMSKQSSENELKNPEFEKEASGSKELIDQSQSSDEGVEVDNQESSFLESVKGGPPRAPTEEPPMTEPLEIENSPLPPPAAEEEEREYGCKYCSKKFSNKQALGGHQNAHKVERTIEKNCKEGRAANFGHLPGSGGGPSFFPRMNSPPHFNFAGSLFNRSQEFYGATLNRPYFPQEGTMQHGLMPYVHAPDPHPGINDAYPGNFFQFIASPDPLRVENQPPGLGFSTPGSGTSTSFPMLVPNRNFEEGSTNLQINVRENQQVEDESSLDLSLRL